jgi:hypothetical protein
MFKIKNSQITDESLSVLNELIDKDIKASSAFKLTRIIKHLSQIVDDKLKLERKILERWVVRDENGVIVRPTDENGNIIPDAVKISDITKFESQMIELGECENEIPFDRLEFEELELETAKIKDLLKIEFLFN